mmetsp:Transcript_18481/g.50842  ORF Transcript_18481/g.50842 Transcript_18481/m.50842 type:complete len:232 (+) Transcript_18481:1-696(+)
MKHPSHFGSSGSRLLRTKWLGCFIAHYAFRYGGRRGGPPVAGRAPLLRREGSAFLVRPGVLLRQPLHQRAELHGEQLCILLQDRLAQGSEWRKLVGQEWQTGRQAHGQVTKSREAVEGHTRPWSISNSTGIVVQDGPEAGDPAREHFDGEQVPDLAHRLVQAGSGVPHLGRLRAHARTRGADAGADAEESVTWSRPLLQKLRQLPVALCRLLEAVEPTGRLRTSTESIAGE